MNKPFRKPVSEFEELLTLSVELASLSPKMYAYVKGLHAENSRLKRELGLLRLRRDLDRDEANLAASEPVSMFHRPQA